MKAIGQMVALTLLAVAPEMVIGQTVADARNASLGSSVTVSGIVTSGDELGSVRYVQDATGGIAAFPGSGSQPGFSPMPGDNVTVSGTLTNYSGLLEITPISSYTVNSSGNALPAAQLITPSGMDESVEGELVHMVAVQFSGSGNFTAGNTTITANGESTSIYLRAGHPLIGTPIPAGPVDITGIASQYDPSPPYTSGYQLLPRGAADITVSSVLSVIPPVVQSNLVTSGFTLAWQTNLVGSSQVFYGTTTALGSVAGNATPVTAHSVSISGLQAATFYYAQPFSVADGDTAFAPVGLYSTESMSSGAIHVYFTKSVDTSVSNGLDAIPLYQATDDTIKAYLDRAQHTIDIAMYNTNSTFLVSAVNAALGRGVEVRWIAEGSNANTALAGLDPAIPVLYRMDGLGSGTHDKFFAIDAEYPQLATVLSGSCNWTTESMFNDYNNLVFIQDQALARCYVREFEEMWGGSGAQPDAALSKFGANKTDNTPHLFNIGGVEVQSFFSPTDGTTAHIVNALNTADHNLRIAMYTFTQNDLGDAVLAAHDRPGMLVQGDVEDIDVPGSEFDYLVSHGVELYSHLDEPGLLHHKYAIIDEGTDSDPLVVTGSHNWTATAESTNDENTLIIHDATIANLFYQEWNARHNAVAGIDEANSATSVNAWPVPASDQLHVSFQDALSHEVTLTDVMGRTVARITAVSSATLDVSAFPAGVYTLSCVSGTSRSQRTIMVMR